MKRTDIIHTGAWLFAAALGMAGTVAPAANPNQVAGVAATRGPICIAASPSKVQVRFCLAPEVSASARNPAKVKVQIGVFGEAKPSSTAADPELWALYE